MIAHLMLSVGGTTIVIADPDETGTVSIQLLDGGLVRASTIDNRDRLALIEILSHSHRLPANEREGAAAARQIEEARRIYAAALGTESEVAARRNLESVIARAGTARRPS